MTMDRKTADMPVRLVIGFLVALFMIRWVKKQS
jgi:hypothetical protein